MNLFFHCTYTQISLKIKRKPFSRFYLNHFFQIFAALNTNKTILLGEDSGETCFDYVKRKISNKKIRHANSLIFMTNR